MVYKADIISLYICCFKDFTKLDEVKSVSELLADKLDISLPSEHM